MIPHWKMINYYMLSFRCSLFARWETFVSPHARLIRHNSRSWSSSIAAQIRVSTIMDDLSRPEVRIRRRITRQLRTRPAWRELKDGEKRGFGQIRSNSERYESCNQETWNSQLQTSTSWYLSTSGCFRKGWRDVRHTSAPVISSCM